jgi:hypothetical protein
MQILTVDVNLRAKEKSYLSQDKLNFTEVQQNPSYENILK